MNGPTVEKEGTPNSGFWDQHAVFEWVQKYIPLVGGATKDVTAMGISAGGGSMIHHLVAEGGKLDPLFTKAIIQSPGYEAVQDRAGTVEQRFKEFEKEAGCENQGLKCLRAKDSATLGKASSAVSSKVPKGSFAFGPGPDLKYIVASPVLEFSAGKSACLAFEQH
jgi:carboxylesterase type B